MEKVIGEYDIMSRSKQKCIHVLVLLSYTLLYIYSIGFDTVSPLNIFRYILVYGLCLNVFYR